MKLISSYLLLPQMKFYAFHGVMPQEQCVGAEFIVSIEAKLNFQEALLSDYLEGTVSYADVHQAVKEEMAIPSALLEHVAGRIAQRLFTSFPLIESIKIEVMKQNPPMGADIPTAGVRIEVQR